MTLSAFLTFLTRRLCFQVSASEPRQRFEISPYLPRGRLEPLIVGPKGDDRSGRPEYVSTASTLRRALTRNSNCSASGSRARALALLAKRT